MMVTGSRVCSVIVQTKQADKITARMAISSNCRQGVDKNRDLTTSSKMLINAYIKLIS